ncbi:MAG: hypothetical protein NUV80_04940 [Candidatus Berkelbacteria bacterium]|nr:hypothetical protein [Candidatus Berkelbacteria bacterium]
MSFNIGGKLTNKGTIIIEGSAKSTMEKVTTSIGIVVSSKEWFENFHKDNPSDKQVDVQVIHEGVTKNFSYNEFVKLLGFSKEVREDG